MESRKALKEGFQESVDVDKDDTPYLQNYRPNVLVGTMGVIKVGHTLTKACTLVIFEPDHLIGNEQQVRKRVHRFGQVKPCSIYKIFCNQIPQELAVLQKQVYRTLLGQTLEKTLDELLRDSQESAAAEEPVQLMEV